MVEAITKIRGDPQVVEAGVSPPRTETAEAVLSAPASSPGDRAKELKKEVIEALNRGELHPELLEQYRIVDSETAPSKAFREIVLRLYDRMVELSSLPKRATEVNLCDEKSANAFYLHRTGSQFGFHRGLCAGAEAVGSLDMFVAIVAHELAHREYRIRYGVTGKSSKTEEAFADGYPIFTWLWDSGFNPKAALILAERDAATWDGKSSEKKFDAFLDEHPSEPLRLSLAKACLSWLELERGDCPTTYMPLDTERVTVDGKEYSLATAAEDAVHNSEINKQLVARQFTMGKDPVKDLEIIKEICESNAHMNNPRAEDICQALSEIKLDNKNPMHSAAADLVADAILSWVEKGHANLALKMYTQLANCFTLNDLLGLQPLGRMKVLASTMDAFIAAKNPSDISTSATALMKLLENEPLAHGEHLSRAGGDWGKSSPFLGLINFPEFSFPKRGDKVGWQAHVETFNDPTLVHHQSDIFNALHALGVNDYRMLQSLPFNLATRFLDGDMYRVNPYVRGSISRETVTLEDLAIDSSGIVQQSDKKSPVFTEQRAISIVLRGRLRHWANYRNHQNICKLLRT